LIQDKVSLVNQLANTLTTKTQARTFQELSAWIAVQTFNPINPLDAQSCSRVMHGLVHILKCISPLLDPFPVLINRLNQAVTALICIDDFDTLQVNGGFPLELLLCLTTVFAEDAQQLTLCWDQLKPDPIYTATVEQAILNCSNAIVRKRARHAALTLNWIDLICWQLLESLEESQVHLCKPVLDNLLPSWLPANTTALSLSQPELVLRRMFDHSNKAIKRYAFNFLAQLSQNKSTFVAKISSRFVFEHVFVCLQDNQVYGDGLPDASLHFLNDYNINEVFEALLALEHCLSPFSLYYVSKELAIGSRLEDCAAFELNSFQVQRLLQSVQRVCAEPQVRAAIQVQLLQAVAIRAPATLSPSQSNALITFLGCLNLKEVRSEAIRTVHVALLESLSLFQISESNSLKSDVQIKGIARLFGAHFPSIQAKLSRLFVGEFKQLDSSTKRLFVKNLLVTLPTESDVTFELLLDFVLEPDYLHILSPFAAKLQFNSLNHDNQKIIVDFLSSQFHTYPFATYRLMTEFGLDSKHINTFQSKLLNQLANNLIPFELVKKECWIWLFDHLDSEQRPIWRQIKSLFSSFLDSTDSTDNTLDLIQIVPVHFNSYVIRFFGKLLRNEITKLTSGQIAVDQLSIVRHFSRIFSELFKSCLELRKKEFYRQTFYALISEFAFSESLFQLNAEQLELILTDDDDRLTRFATVESPEVQAFIVQHVCELVAKPSLTNLTHHFKLLLQVVSQGILFERKHLILMQMLIERISNESNVFQLIHSEESPHFHRNARCVSIVTALFVLEPKAPGFLLQLTELLIQREKQLLREDGVKSFPHSRVHRQQTKIWQFFALLAPSIVRQSQLTQTETLPTLYNHTIESIFDQTAAQLSVRHLQSIILIDILQSKLIGVEYGARFQDTLKEQLQSRTSGVGCFQTLLIVCFHLISAHRSFEFFPTGCLLSCHHYRVRLFAHLVLQRLDDTLKITLNDNAHLFSTAPKAAANFTKNLKLLQCDWFFDHLSVPTDLSWQLVLEQLPRLTDCLRDDWLFVGQFDADHIQRCLQQSSLPVRLSNEKLFVDSPSRLFDRSFDQASDAIDSCEQSALIDIFQRKCLIPIPDQPITSSNVRKCGQLIVCASLIGTQSPYSNESFALLTL
jgi:hypothetical protein